MYKADSEARALLNVPYRQVVRLTVHTADEDFTLTEENIVQGSFAIDRYCVSGEKIEIGSAIAAELDFKLKNDDGRFKNVNFEGTEIYVEVGVKKWDAHRWEKAYIHWIPCGYFIVDTPPRALTTISISALDRMVLFSRTVDSSALKFPMTVEDLIVQCCALCGVECATDLTGLVNKDYQIAALPETTDELTYRQLIAWCAALTGTCAFFDWNGQLVFKWYESTDVTITGSERYESDLLENDIVLTGIAFTADDEEKTEYLAGTGEYAFDLSGNGLIQSQYQNVVDTLWVALKGFCYRPYEATVKPLPYLYPLDRISYQDSEGTVHDTIVTNVTFALNANTVISAVGETAQSESYAVGTLTANQARILQNMKTQTERTITARQQAVLALNELVANSLGLRYTAVDDGSGGTIAYFHDAETLADSTIIYTMTANGFAWTNDWNDGNPTWQYGFTKDGNAVFKALSAYKITAEYIDAHAITADKLSTEYVTQVETAIDDAEKNANAATDEKLQSYSTTEQMTTAINQSAENITLEVSETYATLDALGNYTKTDEVRSKFAMDSTSVTIDSGTITFNSNTLVIDSDNFQLTKDGDVKIRGEFESVYGQIRAWVGLGALSVDGRLDTSSEDWKDAVTLYANNATHNDVNYLQSAVTVNCCNYNDDKQVGYMEISANPSMISLDGMMGASAATINLWLRSNGIANCKIAGTDGSLSFVSKDSTNSDKTTLILGGTDATIFTDTVSCKNLTCTKLKSKQCYWQEITINGYTWTLLAAY